MEYSNRKNTGGNRSDQLLQELEGLLKQLEKKRSGLKNKMAQVLAGKKRRKTALRHLY